ncbi:MAG: hypothetical protein ACRELF_05335 [Gemmataceae bacterium]
MKRSKDILILAFAIVGLFALIFGGWHLYQQKIAEDQARVFFTAPPAKGLPDLSKDAPPPPQP